MAGDTLLLELRSDYWRRRAPVFACWLAAGHRLRAFRRGERRFQPLFEPTETRSLAGVATTRSTLVNLNDNVIGTLEEWKRESDGASMRREVVVTPAPGNLGVIALHDSQRRDDPLAEQYLLSYTDFLTPDSLLLGRTGSDRRETLKTLPASFDASGMRAEQLFAKPRRHARALLRGLAQGATADGNNPTLLYGYGGFEIAQPWYSRGMGAPGIQRGGVLGGGQHPRRRRVRPRWHQAAQARTGRSSYDDFIAVAEDLVRRKITSARHLGIEGGSNGGLLVGAVMVQRPDLFGAVVCQVPLLDMKRYHCCSPARAGWPNTATPDIAGVAVISRYSPTRT